MKIRYAALATVFTLAMSGANAQIILSGNDGHQPLPGATPIPDTVSVIDFNQHPAKVLGTVAAPATLVNSPSGIAVSRNAKFAIVVCDSKWDPAHPQVTNGLPNDVVSVLDISNPRAPKVVQTLHAGNTANGVAMNRAETLALVANADDHNISVFSIKNGRLTAVGNVDLGAGVGPSDIGFLPDGKSAAISSLSAGITIVNVDGTNVTVAKHFDSPAVHGSNIQVTPDGKYALINGSPIQPGATGRPKPALTMVDLSSGAVVASVPMGGVEGLHLSQDGKYVAGVNVNGSHSKPGSPGFNDFGLLQIYSVNGTTITPVTEAHTGHWCQGAAWSKDNKRILVQCAVEQEIQAFNFDGKTATADPANNIKTGMVKPGSIGYQPVMR